MRKQSLLVVGKRKRKTSVNPTENYLRALRLQREVERLNPFPRPRGFVAKFRTWSEYETWRKTQTNPRLW